MHVKRFEAELFTQGCHEEQAHPFNFSSLLHLCYSATKIIELQVSQREISYLPFLPLSQILPENRRDSRVNDETISLFRPEKIAGMKHIPSVSYRG